MAYNPGEMFKKPNDTNKNEGLNLEGIDEFEQIKRRLLAEVKRFENGFATQYKGSIEISSIEENKGVSMQIIFREMGIEVNGELEPEILTDFLHGINEGFDYRGDPRDGHDEIGVIAFTGLLKEQIGDKNIQISKVKEVAGDLHDEWREPRKTSDGKYEPRIKDTSDEEWIKENNTNEIDIANTIYEKLPSDWQEENKASARVAVSEIIKATNKKEELDNSFIEHASATVHEKWLDRNKEYAPPEQDKPYNELSEEEKEKDRKIVSKCIEIYSKIK